MYVRTYTRTRVGYIVRVVTSCGKYASRKQNLLLEAIEKQNHL